MSIKLYIAVSALAVAALSSLLGIWMNRDQNKPPRYAWVFSILIVLSTMVNLGKAWMDELAAQTMREDIARILEAVDNLAQDGDNPALTEYIGRELNAQSRANPDVVQRFARRIEDNGGDSSLALGRHLPAAERARFGGRSGGAVRAKTATKARPATKKTSSSARSTGDDDSTSSDSNSTGSGTKGMTGKFKGKGR